MPKFDFDVAWQIGSLARDLGLRQRSPITQNHASFARATLLAGKHVVVDKPFTIRLSEAEALV